MEFEESEAYKNFTYSFLDTIDISRCVRICRGPLETMNYIENLYSEDYKKFCIEHENNNTLPSIVKIEDDSLKGQYERYLTNSKKSANQE